MISADTIWKHIKNLCVQFALLALWVGLGVHAWHENNLTWLYTQLLFAAINVTSIHITVGHLIAALYPEEEAAPAR